MSISRLAGHLARLAGWGKTAIAQDSLDFRPGRRRELSAHFNDLAQATP